MTGVLVSLHSVGKKSERWFGLPTQVGRKHAMNFAVFNWVCILSWLLCTQRNYKEARVQNKNAFPGVFLVFLNFNIV